MWAERVTAAILAAFERIWSSFLKSEELGFGPSVLDRYISDWVHSYVLFLTCMYYANESRLKLDCHSHYDNPASYYRAHREYHYRRAFEQRTGKSVH